MLKQTVRGLVLASAVGALFTAGAVRAETPAKEKEDSKQVRCGGANACKGKSACATKTSGCMGQNACKGKGWTHEKSAKACTDKGGTVLASET
jgi:hypothetical protein